MTNHWSALPAIVISWICNMAKELKGKLLYQPKGPAGEYAKWAVNLHNGCSHGCTYCYNRRGLLSHAFGETARLAAPILLRAKAIQKNVHWTVELDEAEQEHACIKKAVEDIIASDTNKIGASRLQADGGVFFSFKCDPLEEGNEDVTWCAMRCLWASAIPVTVLTKTVRYKDRVLQGAKTGLLTVGLTLTGHDEMEPNAPSNEERIEALKTLHERNVKTFVSLEPVISFYASLSMIEQAAPYCKEFRIGLMSPYKKDRYSIIDLVDFIDQVNSLRKKHNLDILWKHSVLDELRRKGIAYTLTDGELCFPHNARWKIDYIKSLQDCFFFGDSTQLDDPSAFDGIYNKLEQIDSLIEQKGE